MIYIYEFEVYRDEKFLIAEPFDFDGATQGEDEKDLAYMANDWLRMEIEYCLMHNEDIPEATFGNEPRYGGRIMIVAVEANLDSIDAVQAYKAAEILGVSRGRISQMVASYLLEGFKKGRDLFITMDSINARLKDTRKTTGYSQKKTDIKETFTVSE